MSQVLVTGATGYLGRALIPRLINRRHQVRALVRASSAGRLPAGADGVVGNALDADTVAAALRPGETLVHLIGTPRPSPAKAEEFQRIDLASIRASVDAARRVGYVSIVYLSVAQPAPVMQAYQAVRAQGEAFIADAGLTATILRPWYVLGPGHWWPIVLVPVYAAARFVPSLRESGTRLGLVTLSQMTHALVHAVENPPPPGTQRIVDARHIRATKT